MFFTSSVVCHISYGEIKESVDTNKSKTVQWKDGNFISYDVLQEGWDRAKQVFL